MSNKSPFAMLALKFAQSKWSKHFTHRNNQLGQTLVEFILLLLVITIISLSFMRITNQGLGKLWINYVKLIVDDPEEASKIDI